MANIPVDKNESSIEIYQSEDGQVNLDVRFQGETVWLSRQQMAELFGRDYKTIAKHIANALREELEGMSVVAKFATPKKYGRHTGITQTQMVESKGNPPSVSFCDTLAQGVLDQLQ